MINTCHHLYDNGGACNSAAVTGRDYCAYHLRFRARQLRIAQTRARNERFDLKLPPLEDMFAVQSALNQLVEAVAADMIDIKRAHFLLSSLRAAARFLLARDQWPAGIAHCDQPGPAIDLVAEYGLPDDLDLNTPPEVAFPPPDPQGVILSGGGASFAPPESKDPLFSPQPLGAPPLSPVFGDRVGADLPPMPTVDYCQHGPDCPEHTIRADYPETPELAELHEIRETQGMDAAIERYKQQQRNQHRRHVAAGRKRYAAIALEKNLRLAAERLAERKLAEKQAQEELAAKKPPASRRRRSRPKGGSHGLT